MAMDKKGEKKDFIFLHSAKLLFIHNTHAYVLYFYYFLFEYREDVVCYMLYCMFSGEREKCRK